MKIQRTNIKASPFGTAHPGSELIPMEGQPHHSLSRTRCCVVLGNPLASRSNVSLQFHIPQGAERRPFWLEAQMQTAPINHGPSTSAAKPTLAPADPGSCLALPPEPRGLCYLFIFLTPGLSEGFPQRLLLPSFVLSAAEKCS